MSSAKTDWDREETVRRKLAEREERLQKILANGGGMASEFMQANFGGKNPDGLDIVPQEDHFIKFQNMTDTEYFRNLSVFKKIWESRWFGTVSQKDEIKLGPLFNVLKNKPQIYSKEKSSSLIAHEFLHTRQYFESDESGYSSIAGGSVFSSISDHTKNSTQKLKLNIQHAYAETKIRLKSYLLAGIKEYFSRSREIQARLYEVLPLGYAAWEKMPGTRSELFAALHHLGLHMPQAVMTQLQETSEGRAALQDFKVPALVKARASGTVCQLNSIYEYAATPELQEGLWKNIYPALYGNILEFMGDAPGRARMGLGFNPRPVIELLSTLRKNPDNLTENDIAAAVKNIPADAASNMLIAMTRQFPDNCAQIDKVMSVVHGLLGRPDVMESLAGKKEGRIYMSDDNLLPLEMAIRSGREKMVTALTKSGIDPFQRITVLDIADQKYYSTDCLVWLGELYRTITNDPKFHDQLRRGFEALARAYPNPDQVRKYGENGVTTTLRELMQMAGIEMPDAPKRDFVHS